MFASAAYNQSKRGLFTVGVSRLINTRLHCLGLVLNSSRSIALGLFIFRTVFENILDGLAKRCGHWKIMPQALVSIEGAKRIFHFPEARAKAQNR